MIHVKGMLQKHLLKAKKQKKNTLNNYQIILKAVIKG